MKPFTHVAWAAGLWMVSTAPATSAPLGTEFTYQGELQQGGTPVNGTAHLRFSLWDAVSGGTQVGASQLLSGVPVTDGLFTVALNGAGQFGAWAWDGNARWLQVEVCSDPACASSTVLSPRQSVTAVPYAAQTRGLFVDTAKNVGLGTTLPERFLDVRGNVVSQLASGNHTNFEMKKTGPISPANISFALSHRSNGTESWMWGYDGVVFRNFQSWDYANNEVRFPTTGSALAIDFNSDRVGLGTTVPTVKLDVRGDVKLGPTGQYFAPSGQENLRILRGSVNGNGVVVAGSGFNVGHVSVGWYSVTFSTPFASVPTVTVSGEGATIAHVGTAPTTTKVDVYVTFQGNFTDWPFHFTAIGPR
jgi:hypothetical protein